MTTSYLAALSKSKEEGSRYQVQLKLGTRHRKDSLHRRGRDREESTGCSVQSVVKVIQEVQPYSDSGQVTCECCGPIGPWSCIKEERKDQIRRKTKYEEHGRHTNREGVKVVKEEEKNE
jgi:hypothetical protein